MRLLLTALLCGVTSFALACSGDGNGASTPSPGATITPWPGSSAPFTITANPVPQPRDDYGLVVDVRVGAHPEEGGFNRFVIEFAYGRPPGRLEYVDKSRIVGCGSGLPVALKGDAFLVLTLQPSAQHLNGVPTGAARELAGPGPNILEAKNVCDFEAMVQWAIGTSGVLPFRVMYLDNPSRIVIDIRGR